MIINGICYSSITISSSSITISSITATFSRLSYYIFALELLHFRCYYIFALKSLYALFLKDILRDFKTIIITFSSLNLA